MKLSLIGSSLRTAEKRRLEITPKVYERHRQRALGNAEDSDAAPITTSPPKSPQRQSQDEAAFQRTMGAILHDTPIDEFQNIDEHDVDEPVPDALNTSASLLSIVHPNLKTKIQRAQDCKDLTSMIAYASIPDLEDEANENGTSGTRGVSTAASASTGPKRVFAYGNHGPRNVKPRIDPYQHNHHKVIQLATASSAKRSIVAEHDETPGKLSKRKIPEKPTKVLDAPDIVDDYYLNLISWSKDNILAVAMGPGVYIWNASNGNIGHVTTLQVPGDYVSSVSWSTIPGCTKYLSIGTHGNEVQLWDTESGKCVRKLQGHTNRVSSMAWNESKRWLTTGGRDSQILQHDVRCSQHVVSSFRGHTLEVCGLAWNDDGHQLASGGNENLLCVWDAAMSQRNSAARRRAFDECNIVKPRQVLNDHKAAVKAVAWCPFNRGLLASGGGSADRSIKFWNTVSGSLTNSIDTGSQVCSLVWSTHQKEILSSHGFSENQLILWKFPTMTKIQEFKSHTARVLNMERSPDGCSVVSVGADETLRFWDVFGPPPSQKRQSSFLVGDFQCPGAQTIR